MFALEGEDRFRNHKANTRARSFGNVAIFFFPLWSCVAFSHYQGCTSLWDKFCPSGVSPFAVKKCCEALERLIRQTDVFFMVST